MKNLNFMELWNNSLILEDRELKVRDYEWASSLGKPLVDRYLAMRATAPTNRPNARSRRKFFAGNVWEFVAGLVLYQLGVVQIGQEEVWVEDAPIRVKGKLDYKIGGIPDYGKARDMIRSFPFEKEMTARFMKVIDNFEATIGDQEIEQLIFEIKSCSQYVIQKIEEGGNILGHDLQIFHYLRGLKMKEGRIAYISKDDALMQEKTIKFPDVTLKKKYDDDLGVLKDYLDQNTQPPPAPFILWEGKFVRNFGIEYSSYLTLVYGFAQPEDYRLVVDSKIKSWNNVLARIKKSTSGATTPTGKPILITDKNKVIIEYMVKEGHDAYSLAKDAMVEEGEEE